jgi:hypothetical protein
MVTVPSWLCFSGDVPASVRCGVERRRVVHNAVRHTDVQAILQNVVYLPRSVYQTPLLLSSRRQCCASATFPFNAGETSVPSPSSQTYRVVSLANQIPKGNAVEVLAVVLGNPGRIVIARLPDRLLCRLAVSRCYPPGRRC